MLNYLEYNVTKQIVDRELQNLSAYITVGNEINTSDMPITTWIGTTNGTVLDNHNTNQQSTAVAVLATMVAILIMLLAIVSTALIWTCWNFKTKEAVNCKI